MNHTKLKGRYRIIVERGNGIEEDSGWFDNLILNNGLDAVGGAGVTNLGIYLYGFCSVGSGTTPPNVDQVWLENFLAQQAATSSPSGTNSGAPDYYATQTFTYNFSVGEVIGTISEIGVGWSTSNNTLFSRALIPDPITLTVFDTLRVLYRIEMYPEITDSIGSLILNSINVDYTIRRVQITNYREGLVPKYYSGTEGYLQPRSGMSLVSITSNPNGSAFSGTPIFSALSSAYTRGNYYRDRQYTLSSGTLNNISGLYYTAAGMGTSPTTGSPDNRGGAYQIILSPSISKGSAQVLRFTIRTSWGRL